MIVRFRKKESDTFGSASSSFIMTYKMSSNTALKEMGQRWDVSSILNPKKETIRYAAIMLNSPILQPNKSLIEKVWKEATLRLCADGGANRLLDTFGQSCTLPHEIRGDLDSLRKEVEHFFTTKSVKITRAASEYATDLQKCIIAVEEFEEEHNEELVVVILGGLSGRLDQTMHTFHVLCQLTKDPSSSEEKRVGKGNRQAGLHESEYVQLERREKAIAISENSVAWLLGKGKHIIDIDLNVFGPTCGLLPFAAKVTDSDNAGTRIWTEGLRWNLSGEHSAVGGFLSTSNHLKDPVVTVETEQAIIWTMEIREESS